MRKKQIKIWITSACIIFAVICILLIYNLLFNKSIYVQIVEAGYRGTQEQWLASLVGEEISVESEKSSYELALENGYAESIDTWLQTICGGETVSRQSSLFQNACNNGFEGTFIEWLEEIADNPKNLGKSSKDSKFTQYELSCMNGFEGTFIEWLVSITQVRIY